MSEKKYNVKDLKLADFSKNNPFMPTEDDFKKADISEIGFTKNLNIALCKARDFSRNFVTNFIPDKMKYKVNLGCSYDGNPLVSNEVIFTDDYNERVRTFFDQQEIVQLLWKSGLVPEWVNIQVIGANEEFTEISLECCGRFTSDKNLLYHVKEGLPPFHVLSPTLPHDYEENKNKFDLYWQKKS